MKFIRQLVTPLFLVLSLPGLAANPLTAFQRGDFEQAAQELESAHAVVSPKQNPSDYIDISVRLAIAYQKLGLLQKAKTLLQSVKPLAQQHDSVRDAIVLGHLTDVYLAIGRSNEETCLTQTQSQQQAAEYINEAVNRVQAQPRLLADFLNKKANLLMTQGQCDDALLTYLESVQIAKTLNDKPFEAKIWMNLAQAIVQSGNYEFVEQQFDHAVFDFYRTIFQQIQALPDSHDKVFSLIGLAQLMRQLSVASFDEQRPLCNQANEWRSTSPTGLLNARGNTALPPLDIQKQLFQPVADSDDAVISAAQAKQLYRHRYHALTQALQIAQQLQDVRAMSYAKGYLGQLYQQAQRYDEAARLTRQALFYAQQQYYYPELLYRWQWQLGQLFKAQGFAQNAISAYQQAIKHLESDKVRHSLKGGYHPILDSFRQTTGALYFQLTDLLLQQARLDEATKSIEKFKQAELRDYFQDDCLFERQRIYTKTKIDDALPAQTAVLYPIMLENRLELLLSFANHTKQFVNEVEYSQLELEVKQFRKLLSKKNDEMALQNHAKNLYEWLIKPIADTLNLEQIKTLVIVPDGILLTIPFAALYDGKTYLIHQDYALVVTPSLKIQDLTPMPRKHHRILLGGYSKPISTKGRTFNSLPNALPELKQIRRQVGVEKFQFTVVTDEQFLLSTLQSALETGVKTQRPYQIIHLATHGHFDRDPNSSFLVTDNEDEPITLNQLRGLIESTALKNPLELLTLSACQTALGNERAALGLAGIALKAGARSAVASLWLVDDPATALLMPKFYHHLMNEKLSKAQALQQAQRDTSTTEYSHPYYWAAFILIGNWL